MVLCACHVSRVIHRSSHPSQALGRVQNRADGQDAGRHSRCVDACQASGSVYMILLYASMQRRSCLLSWDVTCCREAITKC